ncbi:MAG: FAD/NAD(P)-binding protein, partial [Micavibrio aeruginosavorus]|nr:FAD/NAD(P)-binding protein [Micavibrio aeruginosavorus]
MTRKIVIVGGGFCGTMVLHHLMQQGGLPPLDIAFYDDHGRHGRGVAYSTPYPEHLLNVPAGGMSALPDHADHFVKWLGQGADPARFYPRMTYGDYLHHFMDEALALAKTRGHHIRLLTEAFPLDAGRNEDTFYVFATGTSQPRWPGGAVAEDARLLAHPYGGSVPSSAKCVIILGTGLSAVDAILTLNKTGYMGRIVCISRGGLWPVSHGPKTQPWHWRWYIDSLRPHSNKLWRKLPDGVRNFCLRRVTFWNVIRHRMPPEVAATIRAMKKSGQLQTRRGSIAAIKASPDKIEIALKSGKSIAGDAVINCLGFIGQNKQPATALRL